MERGEVFPFPDEAGLAGGIAVEELAVGGAADVTFPALLVDLESVAALLLK